MSDSETNNYLLVRPTSGLCNQLICIANGVLLAHITKRNLCIAGFQCDYRHPDTIPIQNIIDISCFNAAIAQLKLTTKVLTDIGNNRFKKANPSRKYDKIPYMKSQLIDFLIAPPNRSVQYLDIGYPFHFDLININKELENQRIEVINQIPFKKTWHDIARYIKEQLGLIRYTVVHLRLEDDMLQHLSNDILYRSLDDIDASLKKEYDNEFSTLLNKYQMIYICTSLCKHDNKNNAYLQKVLDLSFKFVIYYGLPDNWIDVTSKAIQLIKENVLIIPSGDAARIQLFGDPVPESIKKIRILKEGVENIYDHNEIIELDVPKNKSIIRDSSKIDLSQFNCISNCVFNCISGREILALIDFIIALDADFFIGLQYSSFSRLIYSRKQSITSMKARFLRHRYRRLPLVRSINSRLISI